GIPVTTLYDWMHQADADAGEGPSDKPTISEKEELARLRRENERLRQERDFLKKSGGLLRERRDLRFACIHAEKANFPIALMCRWLAVSRAGYYAWASRPEAARTILDRALVVEIKAIHAATRRAYGSPRMHAE